ncbi:MAG: BatD family protein, partial [Candidatus Delongbacteria bacterium]|nr:BatD family protein [Candidatus Delongbacteria bacterium]
MNRILRHILIIVIVTLITGVLYGQKAVRMSSSATEMFKNDAFELQIILENFESEVSVQYPQFADLIKVSGPYQSSSTSIINGSMTKSITLTYQFSPKRTGKITIEPTVVTEGNETYRSNRININVFEQGQNTGGDSRDMFIITEISSKDVFVGEMIKLDYTLYIKPEIILSLPSLTSEPKFTNFVKDPVEFSQEKSRTLIQTIYNGQKYNTLPVRSYWITPTASGEKVIESVSVNVPIEVKTKRRKSMFN